MILTSYIWPDPTGVRIGVLEQLFALPDDHLTVIGAHVPDMCVPGRRLGHMCQPAICLLAGHPSGLMQPVKLVMGEVAKTTQVAVGEAPSGLLGDRVRDHEGIASGIVAADISHGAGEGGLTHLLGRAQHSKAPAVAAQLLPLLGEQTGRILSAHLSKPPFETTVFRNGKQAAGLCQGTKKAGRLPKKTIQSQVLELNVDSSIRLCTVFQQPSGYILLQDLRCMGPSDKWSRNDSLPLIRQVCRRGQRRIESLSAVLDLLII